MARLNLTLLLLVGACAAGALAFSYGRDQDQHQDIQGLGPLGGISDVDVDGADDDGTVSVEHDEGMMVLDLPANPEDALRKLHWPKKCHNGDCRKKCNAKGENGACAVLVCVCWK